MSLKLAIHQKFFESYAQMPKSIQKACLSFLKKFKENATSSAINYEPISTFKDPQLKTCRVNDAYRIIVRAPEIGNTYLILWVDHHDEAMAWAKNKVLNLNEHSNAIELFDLTELEVSADQLAQKQSKQRLFEAYSDDQLSALGISAPILTVVKLLNSDQALAEVQPLIPHHVYSYLCLLKDQKSYEEVYALAQDERGDSDERNVAQTIDDALQLNQNKELFVVVTEDEELERYLNAPSEKWRIFLHSSQRSIVEARVKGSVRVLGGAGTGKTVVALHRVKWLIEHSLQENQKLLFTTYTKTLTSDLKANLKLLLSPAQLERVVITNVDQLVHDLMSVASPLKVAYWQPNSAHLESKKLQEAWESSLKDKPTELSAEFMRMEWEQVILAQGINTQKAYLRVLRKGRGKALSASQRRAVWACFEIYMNKIVELKLLEPDMAMWELTRLALQGEVPFPYQAVVVDELQDMSTAALRLLRVLTPSGDNDLFLVGDGHQKIYPRPLSMSSTGIKIQGKGHAHRLRINYRTTQEIHKRAMQVLQEGEVSDLDGQQNALSLYQSLTIGEVPVVHQGGTQAERDQALKSWLTQSLQAPQSANVQEALRELCVVVRTNQQRELFFQKLTSWGIEAVIVDSATVLSPELQGVRVMTAHRVKGLEFKGVALVDWSADYAPPIADTSGDSEYSAQLKREERSLAYVAMSRARMSLFVSYVGSA